MKVSEIRELEFEEMQSKVDDLREELFNLRFQHGTGQLEDTTKLKQAKKNLARLKTIIREVELKQDTQKE